MYTSITKIAEMCYVQGQMLAFSITKTLVLSEGGLFFAKPMRSRHYVTMMDPFQQRYGNICTTLLLIPALIGDILWVASILAALGNWPLTLQEGLGRPAVFET